MMSLNFTPRLAVRFAGSAMLALTFTLGACAPGGSTEKSSRAETDQDSAPDRAQADIGDLSQEGASVPSITMPPGFKRGDKLVAYEGPGWESDKVGFRIYLDGRNALDIFGKKTNDMVLSNVGRGDDYHTMADWGMDILKVGNSLGAGGFGTYKDDNVIQIGPAQGYSAAVLTDDADQAIMKVTHMGSEACGADIAATYTISAGQRLTKVKLDGACAYPLAAGMIIHPGTVAFQSDGASGAWQYKARYGSQSLVPDDLGLALFYRQSDTAKTGVDADDDYIVFNTDADVTYYTGAAWAQELGGIKTAAQFEAWLKSTQKRLNQ